MKGTVLYGPRAARFEERAEPKILAATDAVIRTAATCVCGSDLWPFRGIAPVKEPTPFGHEYCGVVEEVGSAVKSVKPGQFVVGSFFASDNTCPHCKLGYQTSCQHRESVGGAQAQRLRVPLADGTLVAMPEVPPGWLRQLRRRPAWRAVRRRQLFFTHLHLHDGPAPARRYLPKLMELISWRKVNPGKVFDLVTPLSQVAEGYRAMDERRAIKTLLRP